jgi:hypothetical protein
MRTGEEIQNKVAECEDLIEFYRGKQHKIPLSDKTTPDEWAEYRRLAEQIMTMNAVSNVLNWVLGNNEQSGVYKVHKVCNPPKIKGEEWANRNN